jgi:hypothetical protein
MIIPTPIHHTPYRSGGGLPDSWPEPTESILAKWAPNARPFGGIRDDPGTRMKGHHNRTQHPTGGSPRDGWDRRARYYPGRLDRRDSAIAGGDPGRGTGRIRLSGPKCRFDIDRDSHPAASGQVSGPEMVHRGTGRWLASRKCQAVPSGLARRLRPRPPTTERLQVVPPEVFVLGVLAARNGRRLPTEDGPEELCIELPRFPGRSGRELPHLPSSIGPE